MPAVQVEIPKCTLVAETRDSLGEGVLWDADTGTVWWLDIAPSGRIHRLVTATGALTTWEGLDFPSGLALRADGTPVVASRGGVGILDVASGRIAPVTELEPVDFGNRANDAAADPLGNFWVGTMQQNIGADGADLPIVRDSGRLWRVDPAGKAVRMAEGIAVTNMPLWSPDGRLFYYADSARNRIYVHDYDPRTGDISNGRIFCEGFGYGFPDGAAMDEEGYIWNARWDGGAVLRIAPDGFIDRVVRLPVDRPTNCVFGGPDMRTLFITSSSAGMTEEQRAARPLSGCLISIDTHVRGLLRHRYAG
jgi:sugar lactone lactonase YvrE